MLERIAKRSLKQVASDIEEARDALELERGGTIDP